TVSGEGLEGQVAFWDGAGAIAGDDFLFWNNTEKRLGIGTPNPNARLRVESAAEDFTAVFASTATAGNPQVVRANYLGTSHIDARGVYGRSNPDGGFGVGGEFEGGWKGVIAAANGGDHDYYVYGVHATATGTAGCGDHQCRYGVYGEAGGPDGWNTRFYGVYGEASSENAWPNYGVYGNSQGFNGGRVGVCGVAGGQGSGNKIGVLGRIENGKPDSCYAVYALGHLFYSGDLIHYSDERLKEDVEPISGALETVMRLEPVTFRYRSGDPRYEHLNLAGGRHYGLVAQQLETVLPELVRDVHQPPIHRDDRAGAGKDAPRAAPEPLLPATSFKGITSIELVPILLQAIREQQETIERLERRVEMLERR
ncbi:MAG TPA: hypothetical protein ENO23_11625, partial [Alphaproteobacteria bacterium]|nr:hypothetical protein [Alphaproteobacteria bacterium]